MRERRTVSLSYAPSQSFYDAASTTPERDFGPYGGMSHEDAAFTDGVRSIAISRIRKEVRNNPYLAGLVAKLPEAIGTSSLRSRTGDRVYDQAKENFWYRWTKHSGTCGQSLRTLESILWPEMLIGGEMFFVTTTSGRIQPVPSELCGSTRFIIEYPDGSREINGIRFDPAGMPVSYRFGKITLWGGISFSDADSTVVPARNVIHIFKRDRVHMGRGLPWLLPSIRTARDLYEITVAKTKQIKDASFIFAYLKKTQQTQGLSGLRGLRGTYDAPATVEASTAPADRQDETTQHLELKPGVFPELQPGEEIAQLNGSYQASDYDKLVMMMLHAISTPVGLPVELWFSGLGDINYSGFKGLGAQWAGRRKDYIALEEELFLEPLHDWATRYAKITGEIPNTKGIDDSLIDWRWKRAAILDDDKQASSVIKRLDSGESCIADVWEENGAYAEEELAKRRALYIQAQIAAGEIEPDADTTKIKVPLAFLLRNEITSAPAEEKAPTADEIAEKVNESNDNA